MISTSRTSPAAIISWDHELDAWLNPTLFHAGSCRPGATVAGAPRLGLELANIVEAEEPRLRVLNESEPGHTIPMIVEPRLDPASGQPYKLAYNQIAIDPVAAEIKGRSMWGAISLSRETLLPFLYKLHYTMHLPDIGDVELGIWLMGCHRHRLGAGLLHRPVTVFSQLEELAQVVCIPLERTRTQAQFRPASLRRCLDLAAAVGPGRHFGIDESGSPGYAPDRPGAFVSDADRLRDAHAGRAGKGGRTEDATRTDRPAGV